MRKPRVVETRNKKKSGEVGGKKPKIVEEKDYSLLLERREPENVLLGKRELVRETRDSARDKLREDMLADITPVKPRLPEPELGREIEADRRKRGSLGRKIRKLVGLE